MIMQNLVLIAAVALPVLLIFLLRANGAMVFLSLCAGALLVRFVGGDASLVGSAFGASTSSYSQLALLFAPALLSLFFLRKSMRGPKALLILLPALAVGLVGMLLAVPLLAGGAQHNITSTTGWSWLYQQREVVIIGSVLVSLVVLWFSHGMSHDSKKRKH
jgi:hypothetical protein